MSWLLLTLFLLLVIAIGFAIHFLPTIIAFRRHAENRWLVGGINLFLGWTFIGWVVALVLAITSPVEYSGTTVYPVNSNYPPAPPRPY